MDVRHGVFNSKIDFADAAAGEELRIKKGKAKKVERAYIVDENRNVTEVQVQLKGTAAFALSEEKKNPSKGCSRCENRMVAELQKEVDEIYEDKDRQLSMTSSSGRKQRPTAQRKNADQEFFQMSLLSTIMTHKKQKQLIEMQADGEKLFK